MWCLFFIINNTDYQDKNNTFDNSINSDDFEEIFTKVYHGSTKADNAILKFIDRAKVKINSCTSSISPSIIIEFDANKKKRIDAVKNRGLKLQYVTEVTKDNIKYVKEMLTFSDIRHLDNIKGNFEISDEKEYIAVANLLKGQPIPQIIFSNVPEIVEQQQFVFDSFWNMAIPAEQKIKEIEQGITPLTTYVFPDYRDALKKETEMIKKATKEIQIIYSTANAFHLQEKCGTLQILKEMAEQNKELCIKILTPIDISIKQSLYFYHFNNVVHHNIQFQDIAPSIDIKIKSLVVDRKESLIMELKHVRAEKETASIGFSIYSNSESIVLSYASIFEVICNQSILFQNLKDEDNLKSEFINVAAHELRTPIMPILNGMEILEEKLGERKDEFKREMDIITRNTIRLQNLAESILQVSRIEGGCFNMNIQSNVDIHFLISQVIEDIEKKYLYTDKTKKVSILFLPLCEKKSNNVLMAVNGEKKDIPIHRPFYLKCDYQKINQVIFNLLDNAMKFTSEGKIIVFTSLRDGYSNDRDLLDTELLKNDDHENKSIIIITVQNTGTGVNKKIKDHLFEKFATKSIQGTGLGLYLSKKIVESHGGKIWFEESHGGENNIISSDDDNGQKINTIFGFSLPIFYGNQKII